MPKTKPGTGEKPTVVPRERKPDGHAKPDMHSEKAKAPALVRRIMDHATTMGLDKRVATQLGLLQLQGVITETEMAAGLLYAETVGQYEAIKGHPPRSAASPSFEGGRKAAAALDLEALERMDPEAADKLRKQIARRIQRIVKRYERCQACVPGPSDRDLGPSDLRVTGGRNLLRGLVEEVCCNDRPVHSSHHGTLKNSLALLALTAFKITDEAVKKTAVGKSQPSDPQVLAAGAVEALAEWLRKRMATGTVYFRVAAAAAWQARRITAYGHSIEGKELEHTIKVPRGSLTAVSIDTLLAAIATAKGWTQAKIIQEVA